MQDMWTDYERFNIETKRRIEMNTIIPVIIHSNSESLKCPECGKEEDIKQVCKHCGYEYPEEEETNGCMTALVVMLIIWLVITIIWWIADNNSLGEKRSLWETIKAQYHFITSLKII